MTQRRRTLNPIWFVVMMLGLFIVGGVYTTYFFKEEVILQQKEQLFTEIDLLTPYLIEGSELNYDEERLDTSIGKTERLTILDAKGQIVYDSSHELGANGTRESRPEIRGILEGHKREGMSIRESKTLGEKQLYVAKAIYNGDELIAILRLSEPYKGVSDHVKVFQRNVLMVFLFLMVGVFIMYAYIYRQSQKPIQFILPILRRAIASPNKKQKVVDAPSEWQELYQTVYELMDETNLLYYKQLQNEKKLHFLFENLDIGIFIVNDALDVVLANQVMETLVQKKFEVESFDQWFEQENMRQLIQEAVIKKADVQGEIHVKLPREKHLKVVIRLLESDRIEYVGIVYDVTDIRQIERVHEDFIGNISHELKTPTTSIIGFAETLLSGAKDDPKASQEFLMIIEREGQRLLGLIQNIMMLLKTERDVYLVDTHVTNPVKVVTEELERYHYKIYEKDLDVTFDDAVHDVVTLPGNAFQLVIKNLLENAIEYTEAGGKIFIYLSQTTEDLILLVEDTGIGISPEDQIRIFERFYRVSHSRQRNTGGSGLGLSIVQHYTEILGGTVKLSSDLGEGTTVTVKIPLEPYQKDAS